MNELTILTPTGDRPEAFALCERWMARQTRPPDEWIVIDDGERPTSCARGQTCVRRKRQANEPAHTLPLNLIMGVDMVATDWLAIIEDDDWYDPTYLETMCRRLKEVELAGEGDAIYYHIGLPGWKYMNNTQHASLSATAVRDRGIDALWKACQRIDRPTVDRRLWRSIPGRVYVSERPITVQFKGVPGRPSTLVKHRQSEGYSPDPEWHKLCEWIGDDVERIQRLMEKCKGCAY